MSIIQRFFFLNEKYVVTPHKNHLDERVLMMDDNIRLKRVISEIIPKLSLLLLSGALV